MLAVSSAELIDALRRAGFRLRHGIAATTVLDREDREVQVPEAEMLEPEVLTAILRAAGIPYVELLELLSPPPTPRVNVATSATITASGRFPRVRVRAG